MDTIEAAFRYLDTETQGLECNLQDLSKDKLIDILKEIMRNKDDASLQNEIDNLENEIDDIKREFESEIDDIKEERDDYESERDDARDELQDINRNLNNFIKSIRGRVNRRYIKPLIKDLNKNESITIKR